MHKDFDDKLRNKYGNIIVGIDECGRGAWASSIVAAGVCFDKDFDLPGLTDSKKLSEKQREEYYDIILSNCLAYSIQEIPAKFIDEYGINIANIKVMEKVAEDILKKLGSVDLFVIDQSPCQSVNPHIMLPKADSTSMSVAGASVIAKVYRDRMMKDLHKTHPGYNFDTNKGYIDNFHVDAVNKHGVIKDVHRESYKVKGFNKPKQIRLV